MRAAGPPKLLGEMEPRSDIFVMGAHEDERSPRVSQLLSWCLDWLKLPLYFAAQNTEVLAHSVGSAVLLDVLAHTLPVVLAT